MENKIPEFVAPFLWSYDISSIDLQHDKKRIITNILNYGTRETTDWLFLTYTKDEISDVIIHPLPGEWNKKSLNFWSIILGVKPGDTTRKVQKGYVQV